MKKNRIIQKLLVFLLSSAIVISHTASYVQFIQKEEVHKTQAQSQQKSGDLDVGKAD